MRNRFVQMIDAIAFAFCACSMLAQCGMPAFAQSTPAPAIAPTCHVHAPWGAPSFPGGAPQLIPLCRTGYALEYDVDRLVPDFVTWQLTGPHAIGCAPRVNSFAPDTDLPPATRVVPGDYTGSGYDRGHFAPNSDFQWDAAAERESFKMSNMSPQAPHLNEWQWEQLEATTRAWALARGPLIVMDGPIWPPIATISGRHIAVPAAYWKVIVDPQANQAQAFVMKNVEIPKGPLAPFAVSIAAVESAAGMTLPLPPGIDKAAVPPLWPADLSAFAKAKSAHCGGN